MVVIGGGGHGLATAYYLASRHGITNVGVFERSYIGSGATGRNTTIVRANYKMPESVAFYKQSYDLYRNLSTELDYNLLMSRRGVFWLAHSENSLRLQRERALLNQAFDVDTVFIGPEEIKQLCPQIDLDAGGKGHPIIGASYHPPGAVVRHDAVVWGYAAAAQRLGVRVHEGCEVTGITRREWPRDRNRDDARDGSRRARSSRPRPATRAASPPWPVSGSRSPRIRFKRS